MIRRTRVGWVLGVLLGVGCKGNSGLVRYQGDADAPIAVGLLPAGEGPYGDPVAYAADAHGGRIRALDVRRGTYLSSGAAAAFVRDAAVGTGADRVLAGVVPVAPAPDRVDVWAIDRAHAVVVRAPAVVGVDVAGRPLPASVAVRAVSFADTDGSGDGVRVVAGDAVTGRIGTETFTASMRQGRIEVRGTRSGPQSDPLVLGQAWASDDGGLHLVVAGSMSEGDVLTLSVDSGLIEYDFGATPEHIVRAADGAWVAVSYDDGTVRRFNAVDGEVLATYNVGRVIRLEPADDVLYALDGDTPRVWTLPLGDGAVGQIPLPFPAVDIAHLRTDVRRSLYVARADRPEVSILNLDTRAWVDVNPWTPEVEGQRFLTPVRGLAAMPTPWERPPDDPNDETSVGAFDVGVVVTLQSGKAVFFDGDSGCLVPDRLGPRTDAFNPVPGQSDWTPTWAVQVPVTTWLEAVEGTNRHVLVDRCAGLAVEQTWRLRYDEVAQGWSPEGDITGPLAGVFAREDQRFLAPDGSFSLLLRAGRQPSVDGDAFQFRLLSGLLSITGDNDGDGVRDVEFDLPGDPIVVVAPATSANASTTWVLVPATSSDRVVRIDPTRAQIDASWD
jgi:hypothetical protein